MEINTVQYLEKLPFFLTLTKQIAIVRITNSRSFLKTCSFVWLVGWLVGWLFGLISYWNMSVALISSRV
jgi:hypothetical protein